MSLAAGTRLGPYEIVAPAGAGGMGEVYRARDSRLGRVVAIKVLPAGRSASDAARARFEREAKAISQLSHPNICALFDVGHADGTDFIVMELLEGETLAERVRRGRLPIDEVLRLGIAVCDALEAAHRGGVVHRDLKPANVMLVKSGPKLLDFGLARLVEPAFPGSHETLDTAAAPEEVTREGTVLGTLQYMSPEQLEGRPADARSDIFALGALLHEMVAGRPPFAGASRAALSAALLRAEPDPLTAFRADCPPALDRLVRVCLAKDPAERWQSAHDVKLQLQAIAEHAAAPGARGGDARQHARLPWLVAGSALLALVVVLAHLALARPPRQAERRVAFSVPPPPGRRFVPHLESVPVAVSPDGTQLALVVRGPDGVSQLWLRPLAGLEPRPLPGTEGAISAFWSPEGSALGFFADGKLKRLELGSGAVQSLCGVREGVGYSGSWSPRGEILFASIEGEAILRVAAGGGTPREELRHASGREAFHWPVFLPDGQRFLYLHQERSEGGVRVAVRLSELGQPGGRELLEAQSAAQYLEPGFLVFAREGALLAQRFDAKTAQLSGEPATIGPVRQFPATGAAAFSVSSAAAVIAYGSQRDVARLAWVDRAGNTQPLGGTAWPLQGMVRFAPDGRRALFVREDARSGGLDLWSIDVARRLETRLTSDPVTEAFPMWLPDGRHIVYSAVRRGPPHLFLRDLATGEEHALTEPRALQAAQDVTPDGRTLVFAERAGRGGSDLYSLPLPEGGQATALLATPFDESDLRLSPEGRLAAFASDESGRLEVYTAPFPRLPDKTRVSREGGAMPRFSRNGRELFYSSADGRLMAVPVLAGTSLGEPRALFTFPGGRPWAGYDVAPDGQHFAAIVSEVVGAEQPLTVLVNWTP